jgi:nucleoid DNA-binding protein
MLYGKLVARLAEITGVSAEDVRAVLYAFPDVVMECAENEQVKTYLGIFRVVRRAKKPVKLPTGEWTSAPERLHARLRPGKRLQRIPEPGPSELPTDSPSLVENEPDEDPTA